MRPSFIYTLNDPITGQVRYVGKTRNPKTRLQEHIDDSKKEKNHRTNWIRSVIAKGQKPAIEFWAQVPDSTWPQDEIDYIAAFREMGFKLVNGTDGGEDPPSWKGKNHTPESLAKMSASQKGKKRTPETCLNISEAHKGYKMPDAQKEKIRTGNQITKRTPEYRKKVSVNRRGAKRADNTSGFVGIAFNKPLKKWQARLSVGGRDIYLGVFTDKYDAVFVRRLAEDKYFV